MKRAERAGLMVWCCSEVRRWAKSDSVVWQADTTQYKRWEGDLKGTHRWARDPLRGNVRLIVFCLYLSYSGRRAKLKSSHDAKASALAAGRIEQWQHRSYPLLSFSASTFTATAIAVAERQGLAMLVRCTLTPLSSTTLAPFALLLAARHFLARHRSSVPLTPPPRPFLAPEIDPDPLLRGLDFTGIAMARSSMSSVVTRARRGCCFFLRSSTSRVNNICRSPRPQTSSSARQPPLTIFFPHSPSSPLSPHSAPPR
jgi:hypothetical protein